MPITSQQLREMFNQRNEDGFSSNTIPQIEETVKQDNQFGGRLQRAQELGVSREQALNYFAYGDVQGDKSQKESFFERSASGIKQRGVKMNEQIGRIAGEDGSLVESDGNFLQNVGGTARNIGEVGLGLAGQTYGTGIELAMNAGLGLASAITPDAIEDPIVDIFTSGIQKLLATDIAQGGMEAWQGFQEEHPRTAFNIGSIVEPLLDTLPVGAAIKGGKAAIKSGKPVLGSVKSAVGEIGEKITKAGSILPKINTEGSGIMGRFNRGLQRASTNKKEMQKLSVEARDVVKSGIDIPKVQDIISSSADDVSAYRYMVDIAEGNIDKLAPTQLPKEIPGRSFLKPIRHLVETNNSAITKQKALVDSLSDIPTNLAPVRDAWDDILDARGIEFKKDGSVRNTGGLPAGDMKFYKLVNEQLRTNSNGDLIRTPVKNHAIRQRLFSEANLAKSRLEGFSDAATRDIEQVRRLLAEHGGFPDEYMDLNTQMAKTIPVLQRVAKIMGHKGGLDDLLTRELKAGEISRRLLGNASARPLELIQEVVDLAEELGFKMTDDIMKQVGFADLIEEMVGITQKTGFSGGVERGMNAAFEFGSAKGALKGASKAVDFVSGRSPTEAVRALKKLLERLDAPDYSPRAKSGFREAREAGLTGSKGGSAADDLVDRSLTKPSKGKTAGKTEVFHATDKQFDKFDIDKSQGGGVWFTNKKDLAESGKVGSSGQGRVIETSIDEGKLKLAGWDEYDKFSTQELLDQGFDGVKLPDGDEITYGIFNPKKLPEVPKTIPKELQGLSEKQIKAFNAGTPEEQAKALDHLKLKKDLESNQIESSDPNPF